MRMQIISMLLIMSSVWGTSGLFALPHQTLAHPLETRYIVEGVGIDNIVVGHSVMADVVSLYGDEYQLVEHNRYSYEIKYEDLGLSFYYKYEDPEKKIFSIAVKPPCRGITSRGIIVGESTLQDVLNIYGQTEARTTSATESWFYKYPGVNFHVQFESWEERQDGAFLGKRIIEIEIIEIESTVELSDGG